MIELPLRHPEIFEKLVLKHRREFSCMASGNRQDAPGEAVLIETNAHFIPISGPEIMSSTTANQSKLREIFKADQGESSMRIFIDEIDLDSSKREEVTGEVEEESCQQLLPLMDGLEARAES